MCEGGMGEEIFFLRYEEDGIFLHNLFPKIEITRIVLRKISLQPVLMI